MPNSAPSRPWTHISADFITKLPESLGHNAILVVCDRMSKMAHFIPTSEETSAQGLATLFRDHIWKHHGLPESIISDRGPQFAAQMMKELNQMLGISTDLSTAFHPQTDGQTERMNQDLEQFLRMFVDHRQENWSEWLAIAEFSYNNKIQASTKETPFFVNYGKHPRMGIEPRREGSHPAASEFAQKMKEIHEETQAALKKSQDDMKLYADRRRSEPPQYKIGDRVWLSTKDLQLSGRPTRKLAERWIGPYPIKKIISSNAVELDLPFSQKIHPVVNVSRIRPYTRPMKGQKIAPPPPVEIDGEKEFEVEEILDVRLKRNKMEYLVKWKGYTAEHNSWEPKANLGNAKRKIKHFYDRHPGAIRAIDKKVFNGLKFKKYENYTEYSGSAISRIDINAVAETASWEKNWQKWKGQKLLTELNETGDHDGPCDCNGCLKN